MVDGDGGAIVHLDTLGDFGSHHLHHLGQLLLLEPAHSFLADSAVDDAVCRVLEELECCWHEEELDLHA